METTEVATYAMLILTVGLLIFIWRQRQKNMVNQEQPAIAGDDVLGGAAKNPEQFNEPDDDALDEMQKLLEDAAESQGLSYED
ncbi:MAG: hypothetical protein VYC11_06030 [Candidatus Thermoplasmatota archaeon]|nr:hypothetical protein [Euryarchaeota archaeon]MEC7703893.1 hypothetical protein [Candidatus Thermoplasmatota archaeon]MEC9090907.1 hypothetical protein [Candidatus Thermoplasmatota archaeon]MED5487134.1 hypothetical protein [Candidatus Thermoplasmatota archaeon]|tara:strand:- start:376 stop:624 length:249 start_codon:yes stop_codon:yes gene_type:complete